MVARLDSTSMNLQTRRWLVENVQKIWFKNGCFIAQSIEIVIQSFNPKPIDTMVSRNRAPPWRYSPQENAHSSVEMVFRLCAFIHLPAISRDQIHILVVNEQLLFFNWFDGQWIPTLRLVHQCFHTLQIPPQLCRSGHSTEASSR